MTDHWTSKSSATHRQVICMLVVAILAGCMGPALADPGGPAAAAPESPGRTPPAAIHGFGSFCKSWMGKLQARESRNRLLARATRRSHGFEREYTGYSPTASRCETKPTGIPSSPFVGKLTYRERRYRQQGSTRKAVEDDTPDVIGETEVLEIFRFDGSRWKY